MLQPFLNPLLVININVRAEWAVFAGVHEHGRNVSPRQLDQQCRIRLRGHDCRAIHFALDHPADALRHASGLVVGVCDDDFQTLLHGLVFEMFHEFREKRIRDVRDDKSEHAAATRDESAGMRVGVKIQFLDGFPHPFCGARADLVRTIDRPRHRGDVAIQAAVVRPIGEAVRAVVVGARGVRERPVRVQRERAVARAADQDGM